MNEKDIMHCAAIITAGMIARNQESYISPNDAAELFADIATAIKEKRDSSVKIDENHSF